MPRVIYCIHALSTHLFKLGRAPQIQDLYGKVNFTDAEIDNVTQEFKKYGIQMPAFQKIGGLLTNSMAGDTAALHAAVIAINEAISSSSHQDLLLGCLKNSSARLKNVNPDYVDSYQETLLMAKEAKTQAAINRSLNDSYIADAYDELLTQAEIQGHINYLNSRYAFERVMKTLDPGRETNLISALKSRDLQLQGISAENVDLYQGILKTLVGSVDCDEEFAENSRHWQDILQKKINIANNVAITTVRQENAVKNLNTALDGESEDEFYKALMNPDLWVADHVDKFAVPLYFNELKIDRADSNADISMEDIISSIRVLTAVACVTKAVDTGDPELVYQALKNPDTLVKSLDEENKVKYYQALEKIRFENQTNRKKCSILSYIDIQECIDFVNEQCVNDDEAIAVLRVLNNSVKINNRFSLMKALNSPQLRMNNSVSANDATLYLTLFHNCLDDKHSDGSELWLEDIERVSEIVAEEVEDVKIASEILMKVNRALEKDNMFITLNCLHEAGLIIANKYHHKYFQALKCLRNYKESNYNCPYVRYITSIGIECFLNLEDSSYTWDRPKEFSESRFVTKEDIIEIIKALTAEEYNLPSGQIDDKLIVQLQAFARGYLVRRKLSERFSYFYDNVDKVVVIQAAWRGFLQRRIYKQLLREKARAERNKIKPRPRRTLDYYQQNLYKIIKIQAIWRGYTARKAFHSLLKIEKIPFSSVRHFAGILNINAEDYEKDLLLGHLKNDVVQTIRYNRNLSQQLDSMDIKIALLIQNRITLQDVVAHGKNLESLAKEKNNSRSRKNSISDTGNVHRGLKSLTKEGRKMLEGYQHLFYALQTNPDYLTKLLFRLPEGKSNKFLENVILTLFNFGSNMREEYLLLKLFGRSLEEEIWSKYQKPSEIVTGNPLVLKIVVNYSRQYNKQKSLRQILGPVIEKVLNDKSISIDTNPVDIYKCWRNQLEMETGENQNLPYAVTQEQALNYEQVRIRLNRGINVLRETVTQFLNKITESRDLIPYSMLYMAKILYNTLSAKFPNAPEKDYLKVIGNLIYYHFINAAIVNPDAFDIISTPADRPLSNDQRRNLASIAKILQFAASKKGFGEESSHLICLNPFIIDCHEKFKKFFKSCCQIEDLGDHFNMHEYTEATLIHKPEIYMSVQEICDTHNLLLEYQYDIAPGPKDSLHELLDDLESSPTVASLMGVTEPVCDSTLTRLGKTDVCLILTNKYEVPEADNPSLQKLFIRTKELLVSVLQFLKGDNLVDALESPSTPEQERLFRSYYFTMLPSLKTLYKSNASLYDCKKQLKAYLYKLECGGWVSRNDGYQKLITAVARDLCNKGKYRNIRNKELQTLRATRQRLQEKTKYYAEQVQFYNEYIQKCLDNLHTGKGSLRAVKIIQKNNTHGKLKSKSTLKYSASKLAEKGVVLEIDGLPSSQFRNVTFEITPTEHSGLFTIKGRFMGVEMEKIEIDIQKLLELQFEGRPIMDLFGKAKINVNLLLHLLNRKFYGK